MSRIEAILFDFDGTLVDTNEVILKSWQHTFLALTGKEGDRKEIIRSYGEPLRDTMRRFFGGTEEEVEEHVAIYRDYQKTIFLDEIRLFQGVERTLEKLKQQGYKLALVTSRLAASTQEGLKKFEMDNFFDTVVTADDTQAHKPDPEPVQIALERLGTPPDQALMVGDTWLDIECARNADVQSALAGWSLRQTKDILQQCTPDYIIHTMRSILKMVNMLNSQEYGMFRKLYDSFQSSAPREF